MATASVRVYWPLPRVDRAPLRAAQALGACRLASVRATGCAAPSLAGADVKATPRHGSGVIDLKDASIAGSGGGEKVPSSSGRTIEANHPTANHRSKTCVCKNANANFHGMHSAGRC